MTIQALVRNTHTVSVTFTGKPSPEILQKLRDAGFKYDKGNWYATKTDGKLITESVEAELPSHLSF